MSDILGKYTDVERLEELIGQAEGDSWDINIEEMRNSLISRVRGQDHVIDDLVQLITRQYAKISRKRPVANLLFVGPTGTGKTELCRALAEYLFENESNKLQYDCGQFKDQSGISRLVGSPQGYAGGTGELTTAMLANKRRIVVFDEIEKAHKSISDLFLSMMGEGRLEDQKSGKAADFTESMIVLTSNAEQEQLTKLQEQSSDMNELNNAVRVHLRECGVFLPEIIGRIDRIYVFKELEGIVRAEIVILKMRKLAEEYGLELEHVDPKLVHEAMLEGDKLKDFGARQREQVVEDMLAEPFAEARKTGAQRIQVLIDEQGDMLIDSV